MLPKRYATEKQFVYARTSSGAIAKCTEKSSFSLRALSVVDVHVHVATDARHQANTRALPNIVGAHDGTGNVPQQNVDTQIGIATVMAIAMEFGADGTQDVHSLAQDEPLVILARTIVVRAVRYRDCHAKTETSRQSI